MLWNGWVCYDKGSRYYINGAAFLVAVEMTMLWVTMYAVVFIGSLLTPLAPMGLDLRTFSGVATGLS
jgi:hypothetical protein